MYTNGDNPLITAVIPTYRRPRLVIRAILSVLCQSYPNTRILVLDNSSDDTTELAIQKLSSCGTRIHYHRHQKNIGSNANFNYGLRRIDTPFFSLLCDDDMVTPDFYAHAMRCFEAYPDAMLVAMPTMIITTDNLVSAEPIMPKKTTYYTAGEAFDDAIADSKIDLTWTGTVYRREVPERMGYVNEEADFSDKGFNVRSVARFPIVVHPYVGGILMAHNDSGSSRVEPIGNIRARYRETLVNDILRDANIPPLLKQKTVERFPINNSMRTGLFQLCRALADGNLSYASKVAHGARELERKWHFILFSAIIFCYRYSVIGKIFLHALKRYRRTVLLRNYTRTTKKYEYIIAYVRSLNTKAGI